MFELAVVSVLLFILILDLVSVVVSLLVLGFRHLCWFLHRVCIYFSFVVGYVLAFGVCR